MFIITVGLSHKKAPVEVREKLAFTKSDIPRLFDNLFSDEILQSTKFNAIDSRLDGKKPSAENEKLKANRKIDGCVILSTCNRTEIYAASKDIDGALAKIWHLLATTSGMAVEELQNYLYNYTCRQAVTHLFRVAAGLDSMVVGETEILGQVSEAYEIALENSASNSVMNILFQKAISVGKQVRAKTQISYGAVSVGYAAVELAKKNFGDISNCSILIIGAGEVGELVIRNLADNSASEVMVCNRSYEKAVELASSFGGNARRFNQLFESVSEADIVVACTAAPNYIITREQMAAIMTQREGRGIFLIELSVPRNIDPEVNQLENVHLYNIDDLQRVVNESFNDRAIEADKSENMVQTAVDNFMKWLNSCSVVPVITALREKGADIKDTELEKTLRKMGNLTEREKKILSSMANSIVNKLLHMPTIQLKKYSQTEQGHLYAQILRNLFELP